MEIPDKISSMKRSAFAVEPGGSRTPSKAAASGKILIKVSGKDNSGAFAVAEVATEVRSPLHSHHIENECFYVLEGEYEIQVGSQIFTLKPGASVYGPKLIPHAWHDVGLTAGKMLVVVQPAGGMEAFSEELEKMSAEEIRNNPGVFQALFEKYDMKIVGPPPPKRLVRSGSE